MKGRHKIPPGLGVRALCAAFLTAACNGVAAEINTSKLPPPSTASVDYDRDIKPIFEQSCFRCHGPEKPKSSFRLDLRESALKGGDNGIAIIPGKSSESPLIHYVAGLDPDMVMPPKGKGDPLTSDQISLLRAWIDQGAAYGAPAAPPKLQFALTTGLRHIAVSGDERKFREHIWIREGWAGGLERLYLRDQTTNGIIATAEARAIIDQNDYLLKLRLEKKDLGFVQFGFEQYRRYTDDTGLFYGPYGFPAPSLDSELSMDVGKSWIDIGLTLPDWPRMTLGYEHQYREGDKSSLQFDFISPDISTDAQGRALVPSRRNINEEIHVIKFDLDHEIAGLRVADNFRGEFYNLTSSRERNGVTVAGLRSGYNGARDREEQDHFSAANALTLEKQLRDWLFVSSGYLYSRLDGGAEFDRALFVPVNPAAPSFLSDSTTGILIGQETHAFNLNSLFGTWSGLSYYGGFQNEWMRQNAISANNIRVTLPGPADPASGYSDLNRLTFSETFGAKYTKIPATVLHADARWQQEYTDHTESFVEGLPDGDHDFMRDTDAKAMLQEYRAGATVSPWTKASFSAGAKHRRKNSDYDHNSDSDFSASSGNGYPAFITARDIITDALEARVALHPISWLRATLKYELVSTDYRTTTAPVDLGAGPAGGGELLAGNYDAHIYSFNATLSPWQRLQLSCTFSYSQSRITSGVNNNVQLVPYEGDIYSVISSATFVLSPKTDLNASYFFSRADYAQPDTGANLPAGLAYDRHGLLGGLTWRVKPTLSTKLQYGFFRYHEPTTQGLNNYTAHAVFASLTCTLN